VSNYYHAPDKWILVKITGDDPHYRLFGSWYGGYGGADSWRMNSGITSMIEEDDHYLFIGSSGSTYACHKDTYGASSYGMSVARSYQEKLAPHFQILDEVDATDVINANDWNIK
jgi:hypothetical protein